MNSKTAKQIPITSFLGVSTDKEEVWIRSPFNENEKTPSFKINTIKNVWFDFARGEGGNILDLVMKMNNCDLKKALEILESGNFSFSLAIPIIKKETITNLSKIDFLAERELKNIHLLQILQKRKVDLEISKKYLLEIEYQVNGQKYYSIGFRNDLGGFEARNEYFKGCIGSKTITTIKGTGNGTLSIFEGFMDFLSALTYYKTNEFKGDVIILNSTAQKRQLDDLLFSNIYNKIYLFLDNDQTGNEAKEYFYSLNRNCVDCSNIYANFNDFNDFIK